MRCWQCGLRERRDLAVLLVTGIVRLWMRHPARLLDIGVLNCRRTRALGITNTPYAAFIPIFLPFIQVPALCGNSQKLGIWNTSSTSQSQQGSLVLAPPCSAFTFRALVPWFHPTHWNIHNHHKAPNSGSQGRIIPPGGLTTQSMTPTERTEMYVMHLYFVWFILAFFTLFQPSPSLGFFFGSILG